MAIFDANSNNAIPSTLIAFTTSLTGGHRSAGEDVLAVNQQAISETSTLFDANTRGNIVSSSLKHFLIFSYRQACV